MKRRKTAELMKTHRTIRPERVMALGFLPVIALGTLLLALPAASQSGQSIGGFNALFTATSAVCVTGLVTVDTGTTFSALGQGVLLLLIQTGGLGFMILATMVLMALGRKFTLRDRMLIKEATSADSLSGLLRVTRSYTFLTLLVELIGAVLLATRFVPRFGWGKGIWFSVFHAVSAFCNAGFDLFGGFSSLTRWCNDPVVILTISVLIILGGLGFSVVFEALRGIRHAQRLSLHAKVALVMSGALLVLGTATVLSMIAFLCFQLFPRQIISVFGSGSEMYFQFSERYFRIYMFLTLINGIQPVTANFFSSIGKAQLGVFMSLTRQILFLLPLIVIFPLIFGIDGVMYAGPIADAATAIVCGFFTLRELRELTQLQKQQTAAA